MPKPKRKLTPAQRKARRERKAKFMTIFVHGKQKRAPRPPTVDGMPVDEFIARNADEIWLHEAGRWKLMPMDGAAMADGDGGCRAVEMNRERREDDQP